MPRRPRHVPSEDIVSKYFLKELAAIRPVPLFIAKRKKKVNHQGQSFQWKGLFMQLSTEKQAKYLQKSVHKFIDLLDANDISEETQLQGRLFDYLLAKTEQKKYFDSINAPVKPPSTPMSYYAHIYKPESQDSPSIIWRSVSPDEKKHYVQELADAQTNYKAQVNNFAENLPDRLKPEYLLYAEQLGQARQSASITHTNGNLTDVENGNDEEQSSAVRQRRKSISFPIEHPSTLTKENNHKLTKIQLDHLHECLPYALYYEKKISDDDEQRIFASAIEKRTYIRSIFNAIKEKKKEKYIQKSVKKWYEFLETFPIVVEYQIPTLHLLLSKNDWIIRYFTNLGMPQRPPTAITQLFNLDKAETNSDQSWNDQSDDIKQQYKRRLSKLKSDYRRTLKNFIENILPSDYIRMEFFRNIKRETRDYELMTKKQYTRREKLKMIENKTADDIERIKKRLLATPLNAEQKSLVEQLLKFTDQFRHTTQTSSSRSQKKEPSLNTGSVIEKSKDTNNSKSGNVRSTVDKPGNIMNGAISSDNDDHQQLDVAISTKDKKNKKRKHHGSEKPTTTELTSSAKKAKKKHLMSYD